MVYLDAVYNHFGPAGNYLHAYAKTFFTERHQTPDGSWRSVFAARTCTRWRAQVARTAKPAYAWSARRKKPKRKHSVGV